MINILINGIKGKMGGMLLAKAKEKSEFKVVAGVDLEIDKNGDIPIYDNPYDITEHVDCIVDFSVPRSTLKILEYALSTKTPLVIATTGHTEEQLKIISNASGSIPIFKSSNMSYSMNLLINAINVLGKALYNEYDIEILEKHHNKKIDAPSGTAYLIAESLKNYIGDESLKINTHRVGKRAEKEIGITSQRGGNIVGEHSVFYFGEDETIEIRHTCTSRSIYADGALKAVKHIIDKPNGLYFMKDMI